MKDVGYGKSTSTKKGGGKLRRQRRKHKVKDLKERRVKSLVGSRLREAKKNHRKKKEAYLERIQS